MTTYRYSVGVCAAVVLWLGGLRVFEVVNGHTPTAVLTTAFGSAVALLLTLLAAWHVGNGH